MPRLRKHSRISRRNVQTWHDHIRPVLCTVLCTVVTQTWHATSLHVPTHSLPGEDRHHSFSGRV
ncbi:MAG: hypothetical protein HDS84_01730 [Bacteroidales bacterium]|nr:hypothetical protein [Bacteroidales bacterium]MBD5301636.1 hypothetical protein [Bacteroides sp.]